jgi:hypothetical protein
MRPDKIKVFALDYEIIWEPVDWEIGQGTFGQCEPEWLRFGEITLMLLSGGSIL